MNTQLIVQEFFVQIDKRLRLNEEHLASGGVDNYEDYTGVVGVCSGLKSAKQVLGDIYDEHLKQEEDEV